MKNLFRSLYFWPLLLCAFALLPSLLLVGSPVAFADGIEMATDLPLADTTDDAGDAGLGDTVQIWLERIFIGIGICSAIVKALEAIAGITPSTKDDHYVGVVKRGLGYLTALLSSMALNPRQTAKPISRSS